MSSQAAGNCRKTIRRAEGKVAFITGAARGQGRAHAVRLAAEGAAIIGIDICEDIPGLGYRLAAVEDLETTARLVHERGSRMVAHVVDVRDRAALEAAVADSVATLGRLDFVIANAGVMPIYGAQSNTMSAWQMCLDVMLTGTLNTVETGYPYMVAQREGGSIVLTGSMAALQPMIRTESGHTLGILGYSCVKAALVNLARNYASLLAEHRIRVNTIHPTGVRTPMVENEMVQNHFASAHPEDMKVLMNAIPVRAIEADDIADAVAWLCSDESRFYTGNSMRIDAGASLR